MNVGCAAPEKRRHPNTVVALSVVGQTLLRQMVAAGIVVVDKMSERCCLLATQNQRLQQLLPRGMFAVQRVRSQSDGSEPETSATLQESNLLRPALCRRGPDGELGFHAAVAQL